MFTCNHISIAAADIDRSLAFYTDTLGLPVLGRWPKMFAIKAGDVRLSVFQSQEAVTPSTAVQIVLRTNSLEADRDRLVSAGIELENDIVEAPGFMRFFTIADPSGHILHIAQYFGDPLQPAQS